MASDSSAQPKHIPQVMVSSTFTDLEEHRAALISLIHKHGLHANPMEHDDAKPAGDVIDSSLEKVRDSAGYILVIGLKYGQTPESPNKNPNQLSLTEIEFNEAVRLGRPILLFVMGEEHSVKKRDIESDSEKEQKLDAFRERAKQSSPSSSVHRVYAEFNSLEEFKDKTPSSLAKLRDAILTKPELPQKDETRPEPSDPTAIPTPPAFYAEPDYIGSHKFVGRDSQLAELSDWAKRADPTNLLLFEAIGGNGKSMLTWEWTINHAPHIRTGNDAWAGRFWYSFYERGAIMADFCQRALAYMTERPLEEFRKKKTTALIEPLLAELHDKPWLLILDGIERVLVAYHRIDAAEMPDEEANTPTDKIVNRNPTDAIRDEDNDLLRALAAAAPSKILVSSRLTPRVLLNPSGQPIQGAKRITLPGLRPADAEKLLRSCGIDGNSEAIQDYLTTNCDNHPLVIGILGGLITNYLPARCDFDAWVADPDGGAKLDLGKLDIIQRRNHILRAAIEDLRDMSRQLLSTLALLSDSVDYETLAALNPHLPPEPVEVANPTSPEKRFFWERLSEQQKSERLTQYESALARRKEYETALQSRLDSVAYREAPQRLADTVKDLEQRGLLQYDGRDRKYDLHPVVRAVASGKTRAEDKESYGQRVLDYFTSLSHDPYEEAEALEDLRRGLSIVRTRLKLGQYQQAADEYLGALSGALLFNVEANTEVLSLVRMIFSDGWGKMPDSVDVSSALYLLNDASIALIEFKEWEDANLTCVALLEHYIEEQEWYGLAQVLNGISAISMGQSLLAKSLQANCLAIYLATSIDSRERLFVSRMFLFHTLATIGQWDEATATWRLLDSMGRNWPLNIYRPGTLEYLHARFLFVRGIVREEHIAISESLASEGKNRNMVRKLHCLRAAWKLEQHECEEAATSFAEAVRMARESGIPYAESATGLALAKHHLGQLAEPHREAERLAGMREPSHRYLAMLWLELGEHEQAKKHALAAYKWAWADGEPYVHRYELAKTTELLEQMGIEIPDLPPYDPADDEKFYWEDAVRAAIEKLRAEKAAKEADSGDAD